MAWTLIKAGGDGEVYGEAHKTFLLDAANDINTEPTEFGYIAPGSLAYTAGFTKVYHKGADGTWVDTDA